MPLIHGIYLDVMFNEKYIVLAMNKGSDYVYVRWFSSVTEVIDSATSQFPTTAMKNDIYCGQASELMVALL